MPKCLFAWIFLICNLIFWPIKFCIFMSGKAAEKCCLLTDQFSAEAFMSHGVLPPELDYEISVVRYPASGMIRIYDAVSYCLLAMLTTLLQLISICLTIIWDAILKCVHFCCSCFFKKKHERLRKTSSSLEAEVESTGGVSVAQKRKRKPNRNRKRNRKRQKQTPPSRGEPISDDHQKPIGDKRDVERGETEESLFDSRSFGSSQITEELVKDVFRSLKNDKFKIGSRIRFLDSRNLYQGGAVEWTGYKYSNIYHKLVVVRLDDGQQPGSTDGYFEGQQLGRPEAGVHYLLMSESQPSPIHLQMGDYCFVHADPQRLFMPKSQGFVRRIEGARVTLIPYDMDYSLNPNMQNHSKFEFPDYLLTKAPSPVTDERSDVAPPITPDKLEQFCGRNKGIQGRCNSCYLDTLLFSLFAFSDVLLDDLLEKEQKENVSGGFYEALNCLRYQIVYPLRASHFVSDEHVDFLRCLIAKHTGKEQFEDETRDIPECMDALFGKILSWTPELAIGSIGPRGEAHFNQSFVVEIVSAEGVDVPTTQNLLEKASLDLEFCFRQTPNFMFVQLPREVGRSSIVIPSLELDLNNVLHQSVKECSSCQRNASLQFPQLAETSGLAGSFLCRNCAAERGLNVETARQLPEPEVPDGEEPDTRLVLTAVLCIERSHYNCFARCGEDRWVFFDSMSDQEELFDPVSNKLKKFNIPCVEAVPDFCQWIDQSVEEFKKDKLRSFLDRKRENDQVDRLFSYAYMCLYTVSKL